MTQDQMLHTPVLLREVCELLAVQPGETVLDATVGLGGHAVALAQAAGRTGRLIGMDADEANLARAMHRLLGSAARVEFICGNFRDIKRLLDSVGVQTVDVVLADLGVSSTQLDDPSRGFSFLRDGPLDMRMDVRLPNTAADLVNQLKERELGDLIFHYGEERKARVIARAIVHARRERRINTTAELVGVIADALHVDPLSRRSRIHPATRTFQALRIAVNDELGALEGLLADAPDVLNPGGRIGVISFHSLEDRLVKTDFRKRATEGVYDLVTKKPVEADEEEARSNPRSRSAKLRVARKRELRSAEHEQSGESPAAGG